MAIVPMPREVRIFLELPSSHPIASLSGMGSKGGSSSSITSGTTTEGTRSGMRVVNLSTDTTSYPSIDAVTGRVSTTNHDSNTMERENKTDANASLSLGPGTRYAEGQGLDHNLYTKKTLHTLLIVIDYFPL